MPRGRPWRSRRSSSSSRRARTSRRTTSRSRSSIPECNVPCTEPGAGRRASKAAAVQVFTGFSGEGYARMDFRVDADGPHLLPRGRTSPARCSTPRATRARPTTSSRSTASARPGSSAPSSTRAWRATPAGSGRTRSSRSGDSFAHVRRAPISRRARSSSRAKGSRSASSRASHVERTWSDGGPRRLLPLRLPHRPGRVRAVGHGARRAGRRRTTRATPTPRSSGLNLVALRDIRSRRGTDGRLRDVLRPPHDAVRLRRAAAANCRGRVSTGGRGLFGRGRRSGLSGQFGVSASQLEPVAS